MKLLLSLLSLSLLASVTHGGCNECTLKDVLALNDLIKTLAGHILEKAQLVCTDVTSRSALSTCPDDQTPVSCACGMGCGSWDIQYGKTCHCQCQPMDWTTARCCKMVSST
ncbi:resistin-like beta [Hyperolius riggenbachi]|uniref:resistin-like beta n=1 Tax=Hyperolius riggenbachi TaxID=752182 RepID=UPI0035A32615